MRYQLKIFHVRLGEKVKVLVFRECMYICVKAKLTLVFFTFFYAPSPDHGRVNVALDQTIILGLEIFLDHFVP